MKSTVIELNEALKRISVPTEAGFHRRVETTELVGTIRHDDTNIYGFGTGYSMKLTEEEVDKMSNIVAEIHSRITKTLAEETSASKPTSGVPQDAL